jgi:hypothetical protein
MDKDGRTVHVEHAQLFADLLWTLNRESENSPAHRFYATQEKNRDGHAVTVYAHVWECMRLAVLAAVGRDVANRVMDTWTDHYPDVSDAIRHAQAAVAHERLEDAEAAQWARCTCVAEPLETTCGTCARTWCDRCTPVPAARCPYELHHVTA